MQELRFVRDDSDPASLVLRAVDGDDEFFLPVTGELTGFLGVAVAEAEETAEAAETAEATAVTEIPEPADERPTEAPRPAQQAPAPERERVHLRPKEIQDRIRHGETVEQIVADTGMEDRRVRPFAVPIDMERRRIADMARDAHPVRADGPTGGTLREVLAGAFAARGESLRASEWSAAMDSSDHWVVSVSWTKGNREGTSRFVAEFRFIPVPDGPDTAEPVNSVASDLIDPRFERPVRTVSPVIPSSRQDDLGDEYPWTDADGSADDVADGDAEGAAARDDEQETRGTDPAHDSEETRPDNPPVDLFGRRSHPSANGADDSSKRKKKAVTPHWEDVLLGVRTNPKNNGRNKKK